MRRGYRLGCARQTRRAPFGRAAYAPATDRQAPGSARALPRRAASCRCSCTDEAVCRAESSLPVDSARVGCTVVRARNFPLTRAALRLLALSPELGGEGRVR